VLASSGLPEGAVGGWGLEHFIVDLLMGYQKGYIGGINPMQDRGLERVFFARTAPNFGGHLDHYRFTCRMKPV